MRGDQIGIGLLMAGVVILSALLSVPSTLITAQEEPRSTPRPITENDVNTASQNLYCPVCENLPLPVCPTVTCDEWRKEVRNLLEQGYDRGQIEALFVQRYGEKAVGTPSNAQAQFVTVTLPLALIGILGVGLVVFGLRRRAIRTRPDTANENVEFVESDETPFDPYRAKIEADLKRD